MCVPQASCLANVPRAVARECPVRVVRARGLANRGSIHTQRDPEVPGVRELGAGRDTDLASSVDGAPADRDVVTVLDELLPVSHLLIMGSNVIPSENFQRTKIGDV